MICTICSKCSKRIWGRGYNGECSSCYRKTILDLVSEETDLGVDYIVDKFNLRKTLTLMNILYYEKNRRNSEKDMG